MKAIRVHEYGGPEVMTWEEIPEPQPGAADAVVRTEAVGLNFIDVYHRTGLYKGNLPFTPGMEAAGRVVAVGAQVTDVRVGDRVAYAMQQGSYAEMAVVPAWKLVPLPESVASDVGAATMLQGMTAHYLSHSTFPLKAGQCALIHAGAGGVGLILVQIAKILGATVFATAGTPSKADLAKQAGADHVILYGETDFEAEVKRINGGKGVHVVYDSVGLATWEKSMNCLLPRGYLVLFGNASGPVPPIDPLMLNTKGSLFMTRPSLAAYSATRHELLWRTSDLFGWIGSGRLNVRIGHRFPLTDVGKAHQELEARRTTGKVILIP